MRKYLSFIILQVLTLGILVSLQILVYDGEALFQRYPLWYPTLSSKVFPVLYLFFGLCICLCVYKIWRRKQWVYSALAFQGLGAIIAVLQFDDRAHRAVDIEHVLVFMLQPYIIAVILWLALYPLFLYGLKRYRHKTSLKNSKTQ